VVAKPRHHLDLKDAQIIHTTALQSTEELVDSVVRHNAIGVVEGGAGMGKTFGISFSLAMRPKLDFIWVTLPTDATARLVSQKIVEALTGVPPSKLERNELLRLKAKKLLLERLPLVVIDESQNLDTKGAENVRYLHDCCGCQFPVILAGGEGCWEAIANEPMLLSRVFDTTEHYAQSEKDLLEFLPRYHRVYEDVSPELITYVNDRFCHGQFRSWAAFTLKASDYIHASSKKKLTMQMAVKILKTFPKAAVRQDDD
jgi:hypothetical protein